MKHIPWPIVPVAGLVWLVMLYVREGRAAMTHALFQQLVASALLVWTVVCDVSWRIRMWRYNRRHIRLTSTPERGWLGPAHPYRGALETGVPPSPPMKKWWSQQVFSAGYTPAFPSPAPGVVFEWRKDPCNEPVSELIGFLWLQSQGKSMCVADLSALGVGAPAGMPRGVFVGVGGFAAVFVPEHVFVEWFELTPVTFRPSDGLRVYHMPSPSAYFE